MFNIEELNELRKDMKRLKAEFWAIYQIAITADSAWWYDYSHCDELNVYLDADYDDVIGEFYYSGDTDTTHIPFSWFSFSDEQIKQAVLALKQQREDYAADRRKEKEQGEKRARRREWEKLRAEFEEEE